MLNVFDSKYGFQCESFILPSVTAPASLNATQQKLIELRDKWDSEVSLLILVYSGLAAVTPDYRNMWWSGRADSEMGHLGLAGPQISWYKFRGLVESLAGGRYLYVFNCCAAMAATAFDQGAELLGASGVHHRLDDESSADSMDNGFTTVLARRPDQLYGKPRPVCQMYCDRVRSRTENGVQRTPVHLFEENTDSIVLGQSFQADNGKAFDSDKRRPGKQRAFRP